MMRGLVLLGLFVAVATQDPSLGRGFGDGYAWYNLKDGIAEAKASGKQIMLVMHKSWCGMCKRFGPEFAANEGIKERSKNFVMVNCNDDDAGCEDAVYQPDGGYIPRILFLTPEGKLMPEVKTPGGNPKYQYFYSSPGQVTKAMDSLINKETEEL